MAPSPNFLLLVERTTYFRKREQMLHPTHLTSTQAVFAGSGRLEPHELVVRFGGVLEVQGEIMLCAL